MKFRLSFVALLAVVLVAINNKVTLASPAPQLFNTKITYGNITIVHNQPGGRDQNNVAPASELIIDDNKDDTASGSGEPRLTLPSPASQIYDSHISYANITVIYNQQCDHQQSSVTQDVKSNDTNNKRESSDSAGGSGEVIINGSKVTLASPASQIYDSTISYGNITLIYNQPCGQQQSSVIKLPKSTNHENKKKTSESAGGSRVAEIRGPSINGVLFQISGVGHHNDGFAAGVDIRHH